MTNLSTSHLKSVGGNLFLNMKTGTKSILFGSHQFIIHPIVLFLAWWKLYGFPFDPRLWVVFAVHDLGYFSKPNIDGPEGEKHVEFGANIVGRLFGPAWRDLCLYHSRFYAKRSNKLFSRLCVADKLAIVLEPWWFYLPRIWLSGEVKEYVNAASLEKYANEGRDISSVKAWHSSMIKYLRDWIQEHKDKHEDTWTLLPKGDEKWDN